MLGLLLRGFFLLGIISCYTVSVFQFINEYFRYEYKTYLTEEFKRNKHLQPDAATPTVAPALETTGKSFDLSPDDAKPFIMSQKVKTCQPGPTRAREELDYCNQQKTNDRQSQDDDGFLSYWLDPKRKDNAADYNPLCRADCGDKDNAS